MIPSLGSEEAQAALHLPEDPEDPYRILFESNPQPMWIFDVNTFGFLDVNRATVLKYGYSREEFLRMTLLDIHLAEDVPEILKYRDDCLGAEPQGGAGIWRNRIKDGTVIAVEIFRSRVGFQGREAELIVANDVTARQQAETCLSIRYALTRVLAEAPQDVFQRALRVLCMGLQYERAELWQVDRKEKVLRFEQSSWQANGTEQRAGDVTVALGEGILGKVWQSGSPVWSTDRGSWPGSSAGDFASGLVFPIRHRDEVVAVAGLFSAFVRPPGAYILELMADIGGQLGQLIERTRNGRALLEAEESFRQLFDDAPVAYHEIDQNGVITRMNRVECDSLGYSRTEMLGYPVWKLVTPDQQKKSRNAVLRKLAGKQPVRPFERSYKTADGSVRTFEVHERLIKDVHGQILGIRTAMLDVSPSRQAQQQIAHQALLLENVNDAIFGLDPDFRIVYLNRAAEQLYGLSRGEAIGREIAAVLRSTMTPEERERQHAEALATGKWKGEMEYFARDGRSIIVENSASVIFDREERPEGLVLIQRDITERRRAEDALRSSEERLKFAQEAAGIGIWTWDPRANAGYWSEEAFSLYGLKPTGTTPLMELWEQGVHPDDRERMIRHRNEMMKKGGAYSAEFRAVWPDGSIHWLLTKGRVVLDPQGLPERMVGAVLDITEQKRNEEQLRIFSRAMEQSPVSIVITDLEGNIEYTNPKVTEVTGYTFDELKGKNLRILKSGETAAEEYRNLWKTIRNGEWRGVFHNRRKNGELFWESAAICPIRDACGVPTHLLGIKEDITVKKAMEQALRFSEERFRIAAENTGGLIYEWDLKTNQAEVSGAVGKLLGKSYEYPQTFDEFANLIHPDDRARVLATIEDRLASGEPYHDEYRVVLPGGEVRYWVDHGQVVKDAKGIAYKWIGVNTDITERKLAERTNAELAAIVESADAAIISKDMDGRILTWNAGAERMYGYSAEETLGKNISLLIPADREGEEADISERLKHGKFIHHLETARVRKDGKRIDVLLTISPIRDASGKVTSAAGIAWDVTELRRLERQLAQAQKLESIGQLAAGIAHEINTPIQYIGDNAQFLEQAFADLSHGVAAARASELPAGVRSLFQEIDVDYLQEEAPKAIQQLQEGVAQVGRIVRAMKEFSHPGSAEKAPVDINRAIESTIVVSRNEWKYCAEVGTDLDRNLPLVPCVAGEFNQVILNLLVNAAHATCDAVRERGGKERITVSTRLDGPWAEVRVSDTGTGIPEAIRAKVFDPFFTTKEVGKGTGQGLAIAHSVIVQNHGGTISFETEMGVGTTFIVRLPINQEESI